MDDAWHPPKNATVKNFTSTDFLGPIQFDSPNGGTSISWIKKNVNSPFKNKRDGANQVNSKKNQSISLNLNFQQIQLIALLQNIFQRKVKNTEN